MNRLKNNYHIYALTTVVLWALSFVFTRLALRSFNPYSLGFIRYLAASLFLVFVLLIGRKKLPTVKLCPLFIASGTCGFFMYMITFNAGSRTVTAATSCTIIATTPLITALLSRIIYHEKLTKIQYTASVISFAGVIILAIMKMKISPDINLFLICSAAILISVYNILQKKLTKHCPSLIATAYSIFFGTLMLSIFAPSAYKELPEASSVDIICVLILGIFCGAIAYCCWTKAFSLADNTSSVTNYMFCEPFLTAVFGFVLAKEKLDPATVIGGIIILIGMFVFYFVKGKKRNI